MGRQPCTQIAVSLGLSLHILYLPSSKLKGASQFLNTPLHTPTPKSLGFQIKSLSRGNVSLENPTNIGMEAPLPFSLGIILQLLSRLSQPMPDPIQKNLSPWRPRWMHSPCTISVRAPPPRCSALQRRGSSVQPSGCQSVARAPPSTNAGTHAHTAPPEEPGANR